MRRKRNLIRRYATMVMLTAAFSSPYSSDAQELNAPQATPSLDDLPSLDISTAEPSILVASNNNELRSATASINDSELDVTPMPAEPQSISTNNEPTISAELLQQRTSDGKIQIERWVTEDSIGNLVNHGLYKEYDSKGAIIRTGNFRMGKMDGVWKQTIPLATAQRIADTIDSGFRPPFHSEANFVDGNLEGDWTLADSAGNAVAVLQFENGLRSGSSVWLSSRGRAVRETHYKNGVPDGPATRFTSTQKEPEKFVYYQGKVLKSRTVWHDPDRRTKKKLEESFLVFDGEQLTSHDWWNTQIESQKISSPAPVRHGLLVGWHANGTKSVEGQFLNDKPVGEFQWWYPSGQLQSKGLYENGQMTGDWAWWYPNGMKMLLGEYQQGSQTGLWSQWADDGKLVKRDEASKFPSVRQDILPNTDSESTKEAAVQPKSRNEQASSPVPYYRVRR